MVILAVIILILLLPDLSAAAVLKSGALAVTVVLPSLFPMLVLSSLFTSSNTSKKLSPTLSCLAIGLVAGFPVGAATVQNYVENGDISEDRASLMLPWCNNASPSFVVGFVGASLWGSVQVGWILYFCHVLSAILLAFFMSRGQKREVFQRHVLKQSFSSSLTQAVKRAATSCINITAFIVFFGVVVAIIEHFFGALPSLLIGTIELTQGVARAMGMGEMPRIVLAVQAAILAFAGFSVLFQVRSVTTVSMKYYLPCKIVQSGVAAALTYAAFTFFTATHPETIAVVGAPLALSPLGLALSGVIIILYLFL